MEVKLFLQLIQMSNYLLFSGIIFIFWAFLSYKSQFFDIKINVLICRAVYNFLKSSFSFVTKAYILYWKDGHDRIIV